MKTASSIIVAIAVAALAACSNMSNHHQPTTENGPGDMQKDANVHPHASPSPDAQVKSD